MKKIGIFLFLCALALVAFTHANAAIDAENSQYNAPFGFEDKINNRDDSDSAFDDSNAGEFSQYILRKYGYSGKTIAPTFILPANLRIIEAEAFEGTNLTMVELPDTVEAIGKRAFANIQNLRGVKISAKIEHIAKSAFAGSEGVVLTGTPGGYARAWSRENGIPFLPTTVLSADNPNAQVTAIGRFAEKLFGLSATDSGSINGYDSTERVIGAVVDNRCLDGIAYHILGRSPPVHA